LLTRVTITFIVTAIPYNAFWWHQILLASNGATGLTSEHPANAGDTRLLDRREFP